MATGEVDQKTIGRLAQATAKSDPHLSAALSRLLGLSVMLSGRLVTARQLRRINISHDSNAVSFYQYIIWLSREGLNITEDFVLPYSHHYTTNEELRILGAKLRASFYYIICLFHNHPPTNKPDRSASRAVSPLSPKVGNTQPRHGSPLPIFKTRRQPGSAVLNEGPLSPRVAVLRDTIPSMASEVSCITNPYETSSSTPPPILASDQRKVPPPLLVPDPASFLCPARDYRPITNEFFEHASTLASSLPATSPMRLSIVAEYAEFLSEYARDPESSKQLARRTITEVMTVDTDMKDADYEDAWVLMDALYLLAEWQNEDRPPWAQYAKGDFNAASPTNVAPLGISLQSGRKLTSPELKLRRSRGSGELTPRASASAVAV